MKLAEASFKLQPSGWWKKLPPFFEGNSAEFDVTLDNCWFGRVVLLFCIRLKTDKKGRNSRSALMDCNCAMIDYLYDFAPGR